MSIHFIPVGIQANSKEEAEQKILRLQQIAASYQPPAETKKLSVRSEIFKALLCFGLAMLQRRAQPEPKKTKPMETFQEFRRRIRKQKETLMLKK